MRTYKYLFFVLAICLLAVPVSAAAQSEGLQLRITRDFGYGGGFQIEGTFSLRASGPESLAQVDFIIDDVVVFTDTEPPFQYQFKTGQYPPGVHRMTAVGILADGTRLQGREFVNEFITAEEANQKVFTILVPILVIVGLVTLLGVGGPLLLGRKKTHTPGVYGAAGGAVCKKCQLPFSRGFFSPNMLFGKLERCPHCGKWGIVPAASPAALAEAEERLRSEGGMGTVQAETEEERLRRMINESRYD